MSKHITYGVKSVVRTDQAKRMKEIERRTSGSRSLSQSSLDNAILKEVSRGNI